MHNNLFGISSRNTAVVLSYWKRVFFLCLLFWGGTLEARSENHSDKVCVGDVCTQVEVYFGKKLSKSLVLVVALHGDAPFSRPSYQYRFAKRIALESNNVVAVGILRPGYTDDFNRKSDGVRGDTVGDNYDDERVFQVAGVIEKLKKTYNAKGVILAGHSGGSAIAAKLISLKPSIADSAFIVSCPCNINSWRSDMYKKNHYEGFKGDLKISSPVDLVNAVNPETKISIYIGKIDDITKPYLSHEYHKALLKAGKKSELHEVEGHHAIFQIEPVVQGVLTAVKTYEN